MKYLNLNYENALTYFVACHIIIFFIIDMVLNGFQASTLIMQGALSALAFSGLSMIKNKPELGKDFIAISTVLTPAVLVYIYAGHPWQIDAHMYFFATLAMITGLKSLRALIIAATAVALHHISLNFLMPSLVFPNGGDFTRIIFHAVVVVIETAAIALTIYNLNKNDESIKSEIATAKTALEKAEAAEIEQKRLEKESKLERQKALNEIAISFEESISGLVVAVDQSAAEINSLSTNLSHSLQETKNQSTSVTNSSNEVSQSVQTVASATEELSVSIQEIAQNVSKAANLTESCTDDAQVSETKLNDLQKAVGEIDTVIQSINDVAEQTNLLALNATIEAARAGEAGKGFAVVANEVKSLANETHKMTGEISEKVNHIKESAEQTVNTMRAIIEKIHDVNERTTSIAGAIEQQNSATSEISRNVQQTAEGTSTVSANMNQIQALTDEGAKSTETLSASSSKLAELSTKLNETAQTFVRQIKEN